MKTDKMLQIRMISLCRMRGVMNFELRCGNATELYIFC